MPTIFADSLNQHPIYADRAEKDQLGRNIVCTYATKDEVVGDVLPPLAENAGKVLAVNQSENAVEWTSVPSPAGKADKVVGAVAGDLAALDCEGNLVDSGIDSSDVATYPSFTNNAGKVLAVNAGETGVEWVNQSSGGSVPSTALGAAYSFHTDTGLTYSLSLTNLFANAVVQQNIYNSPFTSTTLENCIKGTDYLKPGYLYHFDMDLGTIVDKAVSAINGNIQLQVKSGTTVIATSRSDYTRSAPGFIHCEFYVPDNINNAVMDIQFTDLDNPVEPWFPAVTLIATKNVLGEMTELPSMTGNAGKVLAVNAGETSVEWVTQSGGGSSLPSYTSSDHGKCLKVNSAGTGVEWDTDENTTYTFGTGLTKVGGTVSVSYPVPVPSQPASSVGKVLGITDSYGSLGWVNGIPTISGNGGKVLKVNDAGTAIGWATDNNTTYTAGNMISIDGNNQVGVSTTAGITDVQIVNALPASPVATVLYLIPLT